MADELTTIAESSARGSFFLISGTALATVIMAIASILIARFLGPELYGQYTLALVIPELLFLFTDLGISQGITKFTASLRAKGETNRITKIIQHGLLLRALVGIVIFIVSYIFADLFASILLQRPELAFYIRIASIAILFQLIFSTATSTFIGLDRTGLASLTTNIQALAKTIISLTLVLIGFSVAGAIIGYVAGYIAAAVASAFILFLILRMKQNVKSNYSITDNFKTLIHYGAPLYISMLLAGFISLYQGIILAIFATDPEIGNYKAALNFATLLAVISGPIATALLPAFSKLDSSTKQKIKTFFKLANKYTAIIIVPLTVLMIIFSSEIVQITYGSTYESAPSFLVAYSLLYFLVGLGSLTLTSFYNGLGETKTTLKIYLISFLILIVLSPILARIYGVLGVIMAVLIANVASTGYGAYVARKNFQIEFDPKVLAKIYIISIASGIFPLLLLQISPMPMLFNVIAGGLLYLFIYITLIPVTRIVNHTELQAVNRITQKIKPLTMLIQPLVKYQQKILDHQNQEPTRTQQT
jgi:O-antigen/teichoic acid export membrane protein